jgi:hypothetical protein
MQNLLSTTEMQWIADNKQWIFDGVGAGILIGVLGFLYNRFFISKKESNSTSSSQKTEVSNTNTNQVIIQLNAGEIQTKQAVVSTAIMKSPAESVQVKSESPVPLTKITRLTPTQIRKAAEKAPA